MHNGNQPDNKSTGLPNWQNGLPSLSEWLPPPAQSPALSLRLGFQRHLRGRRRRLRCQDRLLLLLLLSRGHCRLTDEVRPPPFNRRSGAVNDTLWVTPPPPPHSAPTSHPGRR